MQPRARARPRTARVQASASPGPPAVLITGSSTGIGRTTALHLSSKGWQVFAGVRREADGEELVAADRQQRSGRAPGRGPEAAGCLHPVLLDVTSEASCTAAVEAVEAALGPGRGLVGLVNNAGLGVFLPLELMPPEVFAQVLDVNLTGVLRATRAALPLLKQRSPGQPAGRIVNLGSYAAKVAIPMFGAYSASKFGLEALSDTMRYELEPKWGIRTSLIKASGVRTPIWGKSFGASEALMAATDPDTLAPYTGVCEEILNISRQAEEFGISAEEVAATVETALTAPRPRSRSLIGNGAELQMTARRLPPDWIWDSILLSKLPKTKAPLQERCMNIMAPSVVSPSRRDGPGV